MLLRHEQIYEDVKSQLVRTDELPKKPRDVEILFHNIKVVLCTLGTLSNPKLLEKGIFELVPVEHLVVDEASQIGVLNYLVSLPIENVRSTNDDSTH